MLERLRAGGGLWLVTALWLVATLGLWGTFHRQLVNGTEIRLRAVPVDPRDLLRGDFVVLRYGINTARRAETEAAFWSFRLNQTVFATLTEEDGDWRVARLDGRPPEEGLFLRGQVRASDPEQLSIAYGIESYFVPEGEGRRYEEARNRDRLWAVVSVSPHGVALLKGLEIR